MEASNEKQPVADKERIFEELQDLVSDQLKAISYKWLARHFSLPARDAKRLLFEFAEKHRNRVSSTYLVAGWTKDANPQHIVQLVDALAVADRRNKLDPVTSLHVYSIQPTAPKGPSDILNHDELQTKELFLGMVKQGDANCLSDNRWSAVQCQGAKRDPSLAQASAKPVPAATAEEEKPVSAVAVAIKDAAAGKPVAAAAAMSKADDEPKAKSASAPARAAEAVPAARPAAAKGKGSAIASMWSKAPAKKAKKLAPQQAAAQPSLKEKAAAVDAEAFMRLNQQDNVSSSGEEDEEDVPIRRSQAPRKNALVDSDEEAEAAPIQKQPAAPAAKVKAGSRQPAKRKTVLDEESDSGDDWRAPSQAAGRGRPGKAAPAADAAVHVTASKPATAEEAPAAEAVEARREGEVEAAVPKAKPSRKPRQASAGATPGTVKLHDSVPGPARKKVQRTTYNEKGEEVTQMVYEDAEPEPAAAPAHDKVAEPAPEEKPKQDASEAAAATSRSNNSGGVKRKAGGGVDSKAAKKPAGKGKAGMGVGQRNIASFFAKK